MDDVRRPHGRRGRGTDRGRADGFPNTLYLGGASGGPTGTPGITVTDFTDDKNNHQVLGLVQLRYDF